MVRAQLALFACGLVAVRAGGSAVERSALRARALRGGFKPAEELSEDALRAAYTCKEASAEALAALDGKVSEMAKALEMGEPIAGFGEAADKATKDAVEAFDAVAPKRNKELVGAARAELKAAAHAKLHVAFGQQLQVLKAKAIAIYQDSVSASDVNVQGMITADQFFVREAAASIASGASWSYAAERQSLQGILQTLEREWKKGVAAKIQAAQQMSTAMQYLQVQQAQLQQLQQQLYGGGAGKWNVGAAYRPPDTNINLSFNHQQGRTNIVASMVPDEQQSLLGANGFTNGVGPANLGVTVNVNV
ncbi:hypothetical protein KFE25_013452 [Diacronema lutheri]|uniref:Uncharacterized protein n=1 Tax=Diacronema lutheri TaxID=2081491 RepID=A0A8J6CD94_DIALT|nr:hypothetical protein KFE25_013452 [Diacronema lutheri]